MIKVPHNLPMFLCKVEGSIRCDVGKPVAFVYKTLGNTGFPVLLENSQSMEQWVWMQKEVDVQKS